MEVIDNVLPKCLFDYIRECCISKTHSRINYTVSRTNLYDDRVNFECGIASPDNPYSDILMPSAVFIADKLNVSPMNLMRMRVAITPQAKANDVNARHIDVDHPHWGALLYLNDSDGDTIFWKDKNSDEVIGRVTPKANRAVIFDGSIYHSSSIPCMTEFRAVINYNFAKVAT